VEDYSKVSETTSSSQNSLTSWWGCGS